MRLLFKKQLSQLMQTSPPGMEFVGCAFWNVRNSIHPGSFQRFNWAFDAIRTFFTSATLENTWREAWALLGNAYRDWAHSLRKRGSVLFSQRPKRWINILQTEDRSCDAFRKAWCQPSKPRHRWLRIDSRPSNGSEKVDHWKRKSISITCGNL